MRMSDVILKHRLDVLLDMIKNESHITLDMKAYLWLLMDAKPLIIINGGKDGVQNKADIATLLMRFLDPNIQVRNIQHYDKWFTTILTKSKPPSFNYFYEYVQAIKDKDVKHDKPFMLVDNSDGLDDINTICQYSNESDSGLIILLADYLSKEIITTDDDINKVLNVDKLCDEKYLNRLICVIDVDNFYSNRKIGFISFFELGDKMAPKKDGSVKIKLNRIDLLYNDVFKNQSSKFLSLNITHEISKKLGIKPTDFIDKLNERKDLLRGYTDKDLDLVEIDDKIDDFYNRRNEQFLLDYTLTPNDIKNKTIKWC